MFNLQPHENIIIRVRKHWLVFMFEALALFVSIFIPFAFILVFEAEINSFPLSIFIVAAWELLMLFMISVAITNYYLDILFVTNKNLIDIDQLGLFSRDIATTPIENIEDIKIEIKGILGTWFQFGNLHIQTAGASKETKIIGIRNPQETKDIILDAYNNNKKGVL